MNASGDLAAVIDGHRSRIDQRIVGLLEKTGSTTTLDEIKAIIFNEDEGQPFIAYVMHIVDLFGTEGDRCINALVPAIQDAWNYFPHRLPQWIVPGRAHASARAFPGAARSS
jgi:hypothetical protein